MASKAFIFLVLSSLLAASSVSSSEETFLQAAYVNTPAKTLVPVVPVTPTPVPVVPVKSPVVAPVPIPAPAPVVPVKPPVIIPVKPTPAPVPVVPVKSPVVAPVPVPAPVPVVPVKPTVPAPVVPVKPAPIPVVPVKLPVVAPVPVPAPVKPPVNAPVVPVKPPVVPVKPPMPPATPPPPAYAPKPVLPPVQVSACPGLCAIRCTKSSRPNQCKRICGTCCFRCKCVPPGYYGNREECGACYNKMKTRGGQLKCP